MPPRSVFAALSALPATAALLARLQASERAATVVAEVLTVPGFNAAEPGRCELRDKTLLLRTASSGIAAKLRQSLPSVLGALQRRGIEVIEIKVQVQPERMGYPTAGLSPAVADATATAAGTATEAKSNPLAAKRFADELALTLSESPLREAAVRLSRRMASLAQTREPGRRSR